MAKQVVKLGLEFDTKAAIASYRDLISEMSKGGADPKAIKQFTAAVEKAETELAQLAAEGSTGFTDSKGIEQYQKKVLKTVTSMQQLALRMQEFSKSGDNFPTSEVKKLEAEIEKLKKQITDAQKAAKEGLVKSLTNNGGFTKKEAEAIAETVKTQNELIAKLEEEKRLRDEIRKAAEEPAKKAKASIQDKAIAKTTSGSEVVMEAVGMKGKKGVKEAREAVAVAIQQGIRDGWSAEDVKKRAIEALQASNLSDTVKKNIVQGLEAGFDTDAVRKYLDAVDKKVAANPAVKKYNTANESYGKIANGSLENYSQFITNSEAAAKAQQELADAQSKVGQTAADSAASQKKISDAAGQAASKAEQAADGFMQMSDAQKNSVKSTEQLEGGFNRLADRLKYMFGFTAMFNRLRQIIRSTFNDIQELDKAYASIAYVTNETVGDLWSTYGEYAGMAEKLGQSTADVVKASAIYRQQGLDTAEALELTTDTMKLATIAGNDYSTATQEMTAALRGFKMEMDEGSHVSDVYSELAAHAAASVDDIAQAMSRTASIANSAGMSFENTSAFLTQMIETTQESAENIGTSMKTIIARFTELKKNIAGTADSEFDDLSFNKVDEALKSVGVALKDTTGQFRNLDDVFLELSGKWASLDRNTQRYIATVAAGSRQQSRFIAMMDNYDRTVELINTVADSEGKADEQFAKAADTVDFKLNAIRTKWEEFKLSIMDSSFVKGLLDRVNSLMDGIKNVKMPQLAIGLTIAAPVIKRFVLTLINSIKNSAKQWQSLGSNITNFIGKGIKKHPVKLMAQLEMDKNKYKELEEKKKQLEQSIAANPIKISANIDENSLGRLNERLAELKTKFGDSEMTAEQWSEELKGCGIATEDLVPMLERLAQGEKLTNEQIAESVKNLQTQESALKTTNTEMQTTSTNIQITQTKINGLRNGVATVGAAFTVFATSLFSGVGAIQSFSAANSMLIASLASLAFQAIPQVVTAVKVGSAEAKAALVSTGIGAAIVAAGLLVGLIGKAIAKAKQHQKEMTTEYKLQQQLNKISNLQQSTSQAKSDLQNAKDELKTTEEKLDRFKELSEMQVKTTEEQEEYNNLVAEIRSEYPSIVQYYNSITGELTIQETKTKNILDMQRQLVVEQQKSYAMAQNNLYDANIRKAQLESMQKLEKYGELSSLTTTKKEDKYAKYSGDVSDARNTSSNFAKESIFSSGIANAKNAGLSSEKAIEYNLNRYGIDKNIFLKQAGYNTTLTDEQWDDLASSLINNSNEIYKAIEKTTEKSIKAIEDERDSAIQYYKDMKAASIKQTLLTEFEDLGDASADAISKGVVENSALYFAQTAASDQTNYMKNAWNPKNASTVAALDLMGVYTLGITSAVGAAISNNLDAWDKLDEDTKNIWKEVGKQNGHEDAAAWYEEIRYDDEDYQPYLDDFASVAETYFSQKIAEDIATALESNPKLAQTFEDFSSKLATGDLNEQQRHEQFTATQEAIQNSGLDSDTKDALLRSLYNENNQYKNMLEQQKNSVRGLFGNDDDANNYLENLSGKELTQISDAVNKIIESAGEEAGQKYLNKLSGMMKDQGPEMTAQLALMLDFSEANDYNWEDFKEKGIQSIIDTAKVSKDEATSMFNDLADAASKAGILNKLMSIGDVNSLQEQIAGREEALMKHKDIVEKIMGTDKPLKLTQQEIKKLQKAVSDLGDQGVKLDLSKYLKGDTLNAQAFNDALTTGLLFSIQDIETAIKNLKAAGGEDNLAVAEQLGEVLNLAKAFNTNAKETFENWDNLDRIINDAANSLDKVDKVMNQFISDGYVNAESIEIISGLLEDQNDLYKYVDNNLALNVEGLKELIHTELEDIKIKYAHGEATAYQLLKLAALEKQLSNTEKEWNTQSKDLEDKHKKAMEDYAKAQEDVAEKQKALNEAIAEYNKLLYGSENRQSGLDLLYNYKEAISAFSDEMARAQELIEDSKSVDDSVAALSRYTNAAHQRLAYMNAQNERYDAGLAARRNQLLGGATSYTNELTGNTTTINFGDYVKYNADTGLIALDQKLIQDAKIADEWKDYIEKQVDDYNKLSMESLKNQDEIRKLEKEIQKRREDAIKKYADFEKDIAETLKEAYQKQVDDLKDRYDSMKEADDDYLDALQEAIEKQRKLRERENKWEDLAQKQKKLALMQRDTSGANALENQKLQKEIEKDQEAMLDESIDSAIENMQKLAEKQDELRQTEVELKEALLDNTMYWNQQAEGVAQGFETAEDYVEWFKNTATGLNEQTAAQFENTMNEARNKFGEASEEIAWRIQDDMTQTGDAVAGTIDVTADEIKNIVATTSDTFVDEVSNTFERMKQSFNENMDSAIEKVHSAQTALQEAINKLNEASAAAKAASEEIARLAYEMQNQPQTSSTPPTDAENYGMTGTYEAQKGIAANLANNLTKSTIDQYMQTYDQSIMSGAVSTALHDNKNMSWDNANRAADYATGSGGYSYYTEPWDNNTVQTLKDIGLWVASLGNSLLFGDKDYSSQAYSAYMTSTYGQGKDKIKQYLTGGLVNYTGPAWVDGTSDRPEAFLSSEDTERIGNAAKLLSDIPALTRSNVSTSNQTYGDTNIEINLNIDHISSDVDVDEMLERVKQEIVDVARPIGTNVILQQQV